MYASTIFAFSKSRSGRVSAEKDFHTRRDGEASTQDIRYFHNCKGYLAAEKQAWDDANTLAKAATTWQPKGRWQTAADFWFGKDSPKYYDRISSTFKRADQVHARNWVFPEHHLDIWCLENGPDGSPPTPDNEPTYDGKLCIRHPETNAYSYTWTRWYWLHNGYTVVFCPKIWDEKTDLATLEAEAKKRKGKFSMDAFVQNVGETYLHELMHFKDLVSKPRIVDFKAQVGRVNRPARCQALAKFYGSSEKVADEDGGAYGEYGTTLNALYFQEKLKLAEPPEPWSGSDWKTLKREDLAPVPIKRTSQYEDDGQLFVNNDTISAGFTNPLGPFPKHQPDNLPVPIRSDEPRKPICSPSNTGADPRLVDNLATNVFCRHASAHAELSEKDLSPPVDGAKIRVEFNFTIATPPQKCAMACEDLFTNLTKACQSNSHVVTGSASAEQGCGTYSFQVM
ncbi:MAG: hypothetical protein Q9160_008189 [Pyrenula sp. 1 TL-2023]